MKSKYMKLVIFLVLFIFPVLVLAHHTNTKMNKTFLEAFDIELKDIGIISDTSNIVKIEFKKTQGDKFTLKYAKADKGRVSHFFKIEYSDYAIEVYQDNELTFSGGFNNPNIIRHELMDENGQWERQDIPVDEARLVFRIPIDNKNRPIRIKFYRMETEL